MRSVKQKDLHAQCKLLFEENEEAIECDTYGSISHAICSKFDKKKS